MTIAPSGVRAEPSSPPRSAHRPRRQRFAGVPLLIVAVVAAAWLIAVAAELTGRAQWVHHHELLEGSLPVWGSVALFVVAWQVHVAAMMLPSSLPLITLFRRASARQDRPRAARAAFLTAYLAVWTAFGFVAFGGDALLHAAVRRFPTLDQPALIGGGVLVVAGLFQFTALKDRCLQQCRHPAVFLTAHYRRGVGAAWRLGLRHGLFCLGCCWALMLVMFAVGIANLAWMAPFALLMIYEKTGPGGDRGAVPIGVALIAFGVLVQLDPAWMPDLVGGHTH